MCSQRLLPAIRINLSADLLPMLCPGQVTFLSLALFCFCSDVMAGMTPARPPQRRKMRSPLHEMDGDTTPDDELVGPDTDSENGAPSLDAIAAVVRRGIQTAMATVEHSVTNMGEKFGERFGSLEHQLVEQDLRIAKLEAVLASDGPEVTPFSDLDNKIVDLQSQIVALREARRKKMKL